MREKQERLNSTHPLTLHIINLLTLLRKVSPVNVGIHHFQTGNVSFTLSDIYDLI